MVTGSTCPRMCRAREAKACQIKLVNKQINTVYFYLSSAPKDTVLPAGHRVFDAHYWESDGIVAEARVFDIHTLVTEQLKAASEGRLRDQ